MLTHKEIDEICALVQSLDPQEDGIAQAMKLRNINEKLKSHVKDEKQLSELFDLLNTKALTEGEDFIISYVTFATSQQCATFAVNGRQLKTFMMSQLQKNYQNSDNLKRESLQKLYNSFELLGHFYNKARLQNGSPVSIIGQSLLSIINVELEKELRNLCHFKNEDKFARMVLSQITLNGRLFKNRQKTEIETCMFTIRRCLIEIPNLSAKTKAFLLMTLDLYYKDFGNVGTQLERMYKGFLVEDTPTSSTRIGTEKSKNGRHENDKLPTEKLEKLAVSKTKPANLKLQIKKSDVGRPPATPPFRSSTPGSTPSTPNVVKSPRRDYSAPPARPANSRPKSVSRSPQKPTQQSQNAGRSPQSGSRSVSASPQFRSYSASKKLSPQELRNKKSHASSSFERESKPAERAINNRPVQNNRVPQPDASSFHNTNGNDENVLRPQNSPSSSLQTTPKHKITNNSKVYFREENVENLTWNGESALDGDDLDASTSPKINPYSSSFLNFLSSN